jgi:hypothetical protein
VALKGTPTASTGDKPAHYYERLTPMELEYPGAEVRVYDDRELNDEFKVQFFQIRPGAGGKRQVKAAVFTFDEEHLTEFFSDLAQVKDALGL